ncbi:MAG: ABC transporter permease [Solobacterium sp.]|nr:ABC transporter permease [Solobacterium sp.]
MVVGDGRIIESGTHEELLQIHGKYESMWNAERMLSA